MTTVTRAQIDKALPSADIPTKLAFEQLLARYPATAANAIAATEALQDATALTLSNNDGLSNERVLTLDTTQFSTTDTGPGGQFIVSLLSTIAATVGYRLEFNIGSDTYLDLPSSGRLIESTLGGAAYANDAAAAAGGIAVGDIYRVAGGTVAWRQT